MWQTNSVDSDADATNKNGTEQYVTQTQSGSGSGSTGIQTADQSAKNEQAAAALSAAVQKDASNKNAPLRVLSKGDDGKVVQTNSVESDADAKNSNWTDQSVEQDQSAGHGTEKCGCKGDEGIQTANQSAKNEQFALGLSLAKQEDASNKNAPLRVKSKGDDGSVWQTNSVDSDADATNKNGTDQYVTQTQSGSGSGSTGIQVADQSAKNEQAAAALSAAIQKDASNKNTPLRVDSKGDGGKVVQTNSVESDADAKNSNWTDQSVTQEQSGGSSDKCGCKSDLGIQVSGQEAKNEQFALGLSAAIQKDASNKNAPLRVKSKGDDGSVWQTNSVESDADASNKNRAEQDVTQTQSGSGADLGIQVAAQSAKNEQAAAALSIAFQDGASNKNSPLRVLSKGDDGKVVQKNSVESDADAKNRNSADQSVTQEQSGGSSDKCGCKSDLGIQVSGQESKSAQAALGLSAAIQKDASNKNAPLRVKSKGDDGSVWQTNSVESDADASNRNHADQDVTQTQSGSGADLGIQVASQSAKNHQLALVLSAALQKAPKNKNAPLAVESKGRGGLHVAVQQGRCERLRREPESCRSVELAADDVRKRVDVRRPSARPAGVTARSERKENYTNWS